MANNKILQLNKEVFNLFEEIRERINSKIDNKEITTNFKQFYYLFRLNAEEERTLKDGYFFVGAPPKVIVRITYKAGGNYDYCFVFQYNSSNELMCTYNEYKGDSIKIDDKNGIIEQIKKLLERNINGNEERFSNTIKKLKDDFKLITEAKTSNEIKYYKVIDNNINMNDGTEDLNHSATGLRTEDTGTDIDNDKPSLNLILYGPPGTGKTHCTVDKALERLLPKHELDSLNAITSKDDKRKAQEEKFNELKKQGRIVFTTFHQSMSYEDFIEGIKPETDDDGNVTYEVKPGIFKQLCEKAKLSQTSSNFNEAYNTFINDLTSAGYYGNNPSKFVTSNKSTFGISVNSKGNLSLFTGNPLKKQGTITKDNLELRFLGNSNYNYWESYFKRIIEHLEDRYQLQQENRPNNNNYVLIIDEINRGNVANIFGELITLIEDDKRGKLSVKLPYSKDFSVPKNLYIIGTMNTADRSVEALDTALRRRFSFEEMMPKYDLAELEKEVCDHKLSDILRTINSRIEVLKDRDHLIGHSYLMKVNDENDLKSVFFDKIIPLLQEYFYGDYEKILMVLGDGFVKEETPKVAFAGNGNYDSMPDKVYHIADNNKIDMNAAIMSMKIQEWEKSKAEVILENPEDTNTNLSNDSEQG